MRYDFGSLLGLGVTTFALIYYAWKNKKKFRSVTYFLHFAISLSGLIILIGGVTSDIFDFNSGFFELLLYWFVFLIMGSVPFILVAELFYWKDWRISIITVLLLLFVLILWLAEEKYELISAAFIVYSIPTIYFSLVWFAKGRKSIQQ